MFYHQEYLHSTTFQSFNSLRWAVGGSGQMVDAAAVLGAAVAAAAGVQWSKWEFMFLASDWCVCIKHTHLHLSSMPKIGADKLAVLQAAVEEAQEWKDINWFQAEAKQVSCRGWKKRNAKPFLTLEPHSTSTVDAVDWLRSRCVWAPLWAVPSDTMIRRDWGECR